jgi:hypothetical protein
VRAPGLTEIARQFLCLLECQVDLSHGSLLGLLDEGPDDDDPLLFRRDVERAGDAGFPFQADLPELAADLADVRLFDIGQADGFDQLRNPDQPRPHVRR